MKYLLDFKKWGILEQDTKDDFLSTAFKKKLGTDLGQSSVSFLDKEGYLSWKLYTEEFKKTIKGSFKSMIDNPLIVVKTTEISTNKDSNSKIAGVLPENIIPTEKIKALYYGQDQDARKQFIYIFTKEQPVYKESKLKEAYKKYKGGGNFNASGVKTDAMDGENSGNFYPWPDSGSLPEWDGKGSPPRIRMQVEKWDYSINVSTKVNGAYTVYKRDEKTNKPVIYGYVPIEIWDSVLKNTVNLGDMEGVKIE